jgi:hypothetical protein
MTNNAGCRFQENTPSADIFYRVRKHRKYISSEKKYSYLRHDSSVVYNHMNIRRGEKNPTNYVVEKKYLSYEKN